MAIRAVVAALLVLTPAVQLTSQQKLPTRLNQGVTHVSGGGILSGTNVLARADDRLKIVNERANPIPPEWATKGYNPVGDVDIANNVLYAPFEQPDYDAGHQATARYEPATLQFIDAV